MRVLNKILAIVLISGLFLASCSSKPVNFGQINAGKKSASKVNFDKSREVTSSSSGFQLLLFIPIGVNSRQEKAMEKLIAKTPNEYLTDIEVKESWSYAFVGTVYTTTIKAKAHQYKN